VEVNGVLAGYDISDSGTLGLASGLFRRRHSERRSLVSSGIRAVARSIERNCFIGSGNKKTSLRTLATTEISVGVEKGVGLSCCFR